MIKMAALLSVLVFVTGGSCMASDWPPLPSKGFVTGRAATFADVKNGDAVFVAAVKGIIIGKPLPVQIPQYAILRETAQRVIVIQAEEANGLKMIGVRTVDGKYAVVTDSDLQWLGVNPLTK